MPMFAIVMLSNGPAVEEVLFSPDRAGRHPGRVDEVRIGAGCDEFHPGRNLPRPGAATCRARRRLCRCAGIRRRTRRARRHAGDHGRRRARDHRAARRCLRRDGPRHPYRAGRHRTDDQARQSDHCRWHHRCGSRSAAFRHPRRRRSGGGAPRADGRLRQLQGSQRARRAHDRAQFRSRQPGRIPAQGYAHRARLCRRNRPASHFARLSGRHVRRHDRAVRQRHRCRRHIARGGAAVRLEEASTKESV